MQRVMILNESSSSPAVLVDQSKFFKTNVLYDIPLDGGGGRFPVKFLLILFACFLHKMHFKIFYKTLYNDDSK